MAVATTQPTVRTTPTEIVAQSSQPATTLLPGETQAQYDAVVQANSIADQVLASHGTGDAAAAAANQSIVASGDFASGANITAAGITGTGAWGNTAAPDFTSRINSALASFFNVPQVASTPVTSTPDTTSTPSDNIVTSTQNANNGTVASGTTDTGTTTTTTDGSGTTTSPSDSSTGIDPVTAALIAALGGGSTATGSTDGSAGDTGTIADTGDLTASAPNYPAASVIPGTASTVTTTSPAPLWLIIGILVVSLVGYLWWRKHLAKVQGKGEAEGAAAAASESSHKNIFQRLF